jgi:hypothetical protein
LGSALTRTDMGLVVEAELGSAMVGRRTRKSYYDLITRVASIEHAIWPVLALPLVAPDLSLPHVVDQKVEAIKISPES